MKLKLTVSSLSISVIIGVLIGAIGGSAMMLIVWALVGLVIGYMSISRRAALIHGIVYGFALAYVFMLVGYTGSAPLVTRLAPFIVLGIVGAIYGLIFSFFGQFIHSQKARHKKTTQM